MHSAIPSLLALAFGASALHAQVHDLASQWSDGANPNGAWSYRHGASLLASTASWVPGGFPVAQPAHANAPIGTGHVPACLRLRATTPGLDQLAGDVLIHTRDNASGGTNGEANIAFRCPSAGSIWIVGAVWMSRDIGRAVDWKLMRNGVTILTAGSVGSGDPYQRSRPQSFAEGTGGGSALQQIAVNLNDTIEFHATTAAASPFGDLIGVHWAISYGGPFASSVPLGSGCGAPSPSFACAPPRLSSPMLLAVANGGPNVPGAVLLSTVAGAPISLGGGCQLYLDPLTLMQLVSLGTDATGSWSQHLIVPHVPALAGAAVNLQAVILSPASPLGIALTNGATAILGY